MIGSVLNLGSFFLDVASRLYPDSKEITSAAKTAGAVQHSYNIMATSSVHRSAGRTMVSPMVVIESGLLHQEFMNDLMQVITIRDVVATLTHIQIQSASALGVNVENIIGSINPNRAGLLSFSGMEAFDTSIKPGEEPKETPTVEQKGAERKVTIGGKTFSDLNEYTPLAVGKTVVAQIPIGDKSTIDLPLTFREVPVPVSPNEIKDTFSVAKLEEGIKARFLMIETGEITGPEFLSGADLVKERFRIRNNEMAGYYKEALRRDTSNKLAALRTGIISLNTLANSFVITSDLAKQIELNTGKRFSNTSARESIFEKVKANTIVIVNEDKGTFLFYTTGQSLPELYTRSALASKSKKDAGSNSLQDLVKLLNGGM